MIKFTGKMPSSDDLMKTIIKKAIKVQKESVHHQYPDILDFDITYDFKENKFRYIGLTLEQIKTLPGVSQTKD